ncbi:thioredoxin-like protein [Echria macrotheca]|uniref:Thioredoxin-like protein n=1 Tax=Echria macrotheca TaxID=438768 RepID=A0AAJ0B248_9PEZI|nr:thioredoxin-like protein [Echria macrotheca]
MFGFRKSLDVIQLFHKAGNPASVRVANLLRQVSAAASESATEDQASNHAAQTNMSRRDPFELNITEDLPTSHQLTTILDYVGKDGISSVVKGANNQNEAVTMFKKNPDSLNRPLVVDWNNGKAYAGSEESAILKLLNALPPKN